MKICNVRPGRALADEFGQAQGTDRLIDVLGALFGRQGARWSGVSACSWILGFVDRTPPSQGRGAARAPGRPSRRGLPSITAIAGKSKRGQPRCGDARRPTVCEATETATPRISAAPFQNTAAERSPHRHDHPTRLPRRDRRRAHARGRDGAGRERPGRHEARRCRPADPCRHRPRPGRRSELQPVAPSTVDRGRGLGGPTDHHLPLSAREPGGGPHQQSPRLAVRNGVGSGRFPSIPRGPTAQDLASEPAPMAIRTILPLVILVFAAPAAAQGLAAPVPTGPAMRTPYGFGGPFPARGLYRCWADAGSEPDAARAGPRGVTAPTGSRRSRVSHRPPRRSRRSWSFRGSGRRAAAAPSRKTGPPERRSSRFRSLGAESGIPGRIGRVAGEVAVEIGGPRSVHQTGPRSPSAILAASTAARAAASASAAPAAAVALGLFRSPYRAPGRHQVGDQIRPTVRREVGIGGSPETPANYDIAPIRC